MYINRILLLGLVCFSYNLLAQDTITGKLDNWQHSEAKIVSVDLFSGAVRNFGEIDANGNLSIELEEDFLSKIKKQLKERQENAREGETFTLKNVETTYSCNGDGVDYENPTTHLTGLPKYLYIKKGERQMLGYLMPVSNPAIAKWQISFGQESAGKGKFVEWVYLDEEASVEGNCSTTKFADMTDYKEQKHFNLHFKKCWNLVEHEIIETIEDDMGKSYPEKIQVSVKDQIAEDVQWVFIPLEKK